MSSDWINVQGRSPDGVKVILREETRKIDIYSDKIIDEAVNKIEIENEERTINYNSRKTDLRGRLNIVIDEKNSVAMTVNDLKDEVALQRSSILNLRQKINDADSSIVNSKQLIQEEKDRVQDELNNIPFYEVLIGKVENVPPEKDPVPYEDAIASKISREAIGAQLGVDITNKTIVQDGTLSEETVLTMLKGKVDAILTRFEDQREDESGKAFFDLYRYGLVKVYPFQEDDVFLNKGKKSKIKVEVESLKTVGEGLSQALDKSNLTELRRLINQKKLKNSESELLVKRLARTAKKVLKRENQKIKASENIIVNNNQLINNDEPLLINDDAELQKELTEQQNINNNFLNVQKLYNEHVASEEHVRVYPGVGQASDTEIKDARFSEISANTYEDFVTGIKSEYFKEKTELSGSVLSEIKESKKSDVKLNSIKIVGKFSKKEYGKIRLITYVAYNFGFEFEQSTDTPISGVIKSTPSKSQLSSFTKKERPLKTKDNLKVTSNPSGANVFVSGRKVGSTPSNIFLEPGVHGITIKKDGYQPWMDVVDVNSTKVTQLNATLEPVATDNDQKGSSCSTLCCGVVILGGALYIYSQKKDAPKQTGSVSISIDIP